MADQSQSVAVQFASDLFLDGSGKFTKTKPLNSLISTPAGGLLSLPGDLKNFLVGKQLKEVRENSIVKSVADFLGVGDATRELAKDLFEIAGSIASVVGYAQAAIGLLKALGVFGPDPTQAALARIEKRVHELFNLTFSGIEDAKITAIQNQLSLARPAGEQLVDFLKFPFPPPDDQRQNLEIALQNLREARHEILALNAHMMPFRWDNYPGAGYPAWWIVKSGKSGSWSTPVADLRTLNDGAMRWDYRLVMPAIQEIVLLQLAFFKTLDPAFRTTGRFREEIQGIADDLAEFVTNMTACIQWTRDYNTITDRYYTPLKYGYPVGAVDICSGAASVEPNWKEGVKMPLFGGDEYTLPLNVDEVLAEGKIERERAWFSVYANSAIPEMLQLQRRLEDLAMPPLASETLQLKTSRSGSRNFIKTADYQVQPTLGCDGKTFTADVYHIQRTWRMQSPAQPSYYARQYVIPYHFYIESLSTGNPVDYPWAVVDRTELTGTSGSATLSQVRKFTWEVKKTDSLRFNPQKAAHITRLASGMRPVQLRTGYGILTKSIEIMDIELNFSPDTADNEGQIRQPAWGAITLDYEIQRTDGRISITIRNRPVDGNFSNVYLVIEETPRPIGGSYPPIRTAIDISTVGEEHHLDQSYFDHVEQCEGRLAEILDYLSQYVNVQPVGPPIPPYDPYRFRNIEQYAAVVNQVQPHVLPEQLMTPGALQRVRSMQVPDEQQENLTE